MRSLSCVDAANICGGAVGTIKSRVFRARAMLEKLIEEGLLDRTRAESPASAQAFDRILAAVPDAMGVGNRLTPRMEPPVFNARFRLGERNCSRTEQTMNLIILLVVGGLIGWIASMITRTDAQQGIVLNVVFGIVGSLLGAVVLPGFINLFRRGSIR